MGTVDRGASRRELLRGLAAVGAVGAAGAAGASVLAPAAGAATEAAATGDDGPTTDPDLAPLLVQSLLGQAAPTTPGTSYVNVAGIDFKGGTSSVAFSSGAGELSSTSGGFFTARVDLPPGARATEVVVYFVKNAATDLTVRLVRSDGSPGGTIFDAAINQSTSGFAVSANIQQMIVPVPNVPAALADPALAAHFLIVNMPGNVQVELRGVRVGFVSPRTAFVPLTPGRVYDSRWAIFGGAKILSGQNRVISVRDRRRIAPDDGAVDLVNFVPAGAKAIAYNLTLAATTGSGFLAITPGDAATFGASSINWSTANQILANGGNVTVDASRQVKVFAGGGGSTHFILDVTGYYA